MKSKLLTMLDLQDQMNSKVHPNWRKQDFEWYRAIWTECAELMDHYGWKWWKAQDPDIEQSKLELVDIWHFGLSIMLVNESDKEKIADDIINQWKITKPAYEFREAIEVFASSTLVSKSINIPEFCDLMTLLDMHGDDLYRIYVGKNVLNIFRQDHGYKQGSYIKLWEGREDNEHLVEVAASISVDDPDYQGKIYKGLENIYKHL